MTDLMEIKTELGQPGTRPWSEPLTLSWLASCCLEPEYLGQKQNVCCVKSSVSGLLSAIVLFMTWIKTPWSQSLKLECSCWSSEKHCTWVNNSVYRCPEMVAHATFTKCKVNLTLLVKECLPTSKQTGAKFLETPVVYPGNTGLSGTGSISGWWGLGWGRGGDLGWRGCGGGGEQTEYIKKKSLDLKDITVAPLSKDHPKNQSASHGRGAV